MKEDFHQEDNDSFMTDFFKDNSSLPPRSTIHTLKGTDKSKGSKIIRIIFSSVIFIIIIALTVYFIFYDDFNINLFKSSADKPEITENDSDSIINNPIDQGETVEEEEILPKEEEVIPDEVTPDDQLPDNSNNQSVPSSNTDRIHIIQPGENLYRISLQYYGPGYMEELAEYNNITDLDKLTAGYILKIPSIDLLK